MVEKNEVKEIYNLLTKEELEELNYTGDWRLDKTRFTREYEKNLEIFSQPLDLEDIYNKEDGDF